MPTFRVLCRVDAYIDYEAVVLAESAAEAARLAQDEPATYTWEDIGAVGFDARGYVTLDSEGEEIEATRVGYFG